jgi:hypothetical protein
MSCVSCGGQIVGHNEPQDVTEHAGYECTCDDDDDVMAPDDDDVMAPEHGAKLW